MNGKRFSAAALALTLAAAVSACSAPEQAPVTSASPPPDTFYYTAAVTVNGTPLDLSALPAAPGHIPMRPLCEALGEYVEWIPDENSAVFSLNDTGIIVSFDTMAVQADFEEQEGVKALVREGVTYLPAQFLAGLDGVEIQIGSAPEERYDISVAGNPLLALVEDIRTQTGMAMGQQLTEEYYALLDIDTTHFESVAGYIPMMVNADTIIIGKYAPGADRDAAKAEFEARKAATIQSFENYLPDPLEMAKNGRIVESAGGAYLMLIISPDNERAVELFEAGTAGLDTSGPQPR